MFIQHFTEDGYSALTTAGFVACIVIAIVVFLLATLLIKPKQEKKWTANKLVFSGAALALAYLLSYIQPYKLPWGGSVTLFSMLFICLVGYWYGLGTGLTVAFTYSILQFLQDGGAYMLTPFQVCCDYFLAFTALGLAGLFCNKKNGLIKGYLLGIFVRGLFHTIGGYLYWMEYMPDNFPKSLAFAYPVIYNYTFILIEAAATVALLCIPAVKSALARIKVLATK